MSRCRCTVLWCVVTLGAMVAHASPLQTTSKVTTTPSTPSSSTRTPGGWFGLRWTPAGPDDVFAPLLESTLKVVRTQATYLTRSAAFGPRVVQPDGLEGALVPISIYSHNDSDSNQAMYACSAHTRLPSDDLSRTGELDPHIPPEDWIALVERGGDCSFVDKVRFAQSLGAVAVVVGDAPSPHWHPGKHEADPGLANMRLVTMFANRDPSDVRIPSVFITRPSFLVLVRLVYDGEMDRTKPHKIKIILSQDDGLWEWPLIDMVILMLLMPSILTLTSVALHHLRHTRRRRRQRAPTFLVQNLPCLIVHGHGVPWEKTTTSLPVGTTGESSAPPPAQDEEAVQLEEGSMTPYAVLEGVLDRETSGLLPPGKSWFYSSECAICLGHFLEGERVRVLPCGHLFHQIEVDDWLTSQKKVCPTCKQDVTVPVPTTLSEEQSISSPLSSGDSSSGWSEPRHGPLPPSISRAATIPMPGTPSERTALLDPYVSL